MTEFENDTATLADESEGEGAGEPDINFTETDGHTEGESDMGDRAEYEAVIKKYKDFYTADTQRLINKRFKKYKALEEKVRLLESEAARYADIEALILSERESAVRETEERMNREFRLMHARAEENALIPHTPRSAFDVSRLTKSERALLAIRAQKGEKIEF